MAIVYKATNRFNGLIYIGSTSKSLCERKRYHKDTKSCPFFKEAINYYGFDNFSWIILYVSDNIYDVRKKEDYYIEKFESYKPEFGYNLRRSGGVHNDITKQKMSKKSKGNKHWLGKKHSEETKEKMRISSLGRKHTTETRKKLREINKGQIPWNKGKVNIYSDETLNKMSEKAKLRTGILNHFFGKKHSEETKKKISESRKGKKRRG